MMSTPIQVLFVGDLNYYAKGSSRLKAMRNLGADVTAISHTRIDGDDQGHAPLSLGFKIGWKLGFHLDSEGVNQQIISATETSKPDILWIEKGNMIRPSTLEAVHSQSPKTIIASYTDDDMFNKLNRTHAYTGGLNHYDVVFTTKSFNMDPDELPSLGAKRCVMVDKAYDPDQHFPIDVTEDDRKALGADVGFIGSYAPERGEAVNFLARNGIEVRVWGNGWETFKPQSDNLKIERRPLVNTPENLQFTKGTTATRINLGFLRKINRDLQTDRSIEIPACGGFMLAERSDEHERLFEDGKEAVFFEGDEELLEKVKHYLEHEDERKAIAAAGRVRCEAGGYSHLERMRGILGEILSDQVGTNTV